MENSILSLGPEEFESVIEELGLTPEDQEFLREEYKSNNSISGNIEQAFEPEQGQERSTFLPMTKPEGVSSMDALLSGQANLALPGAITEGIQEVVEGVEAPGWAASGLEGQGTLEDAWKTAGVAAGGAATATVPDGSLRMFGGRAAKNFPKEAEQRAIDMYWQPVGKDTEKMWGDKPLNSDVIWEDTGIELKNGTKAIFQIDPAGASIADPPTLKTALTSFWDKYPQYKDAVYPVDEVLDFPELYENYPELKEFSVVFDRSLGENNYGYMNIADRELGINPKLLNNPEEFRATLLHEMQHGIQAKEMSEGGANPDYFFRVSSDWNDTDFEFLNSVDANTKELIPYADKINSKIDSLRNEWDTLKPMTQAVRVQEIEQLKREAQDIAYKKYLTNEGEVEARAAELWDNLSTEEKRTTRPTEVMNQALRLLKKEYGDTSMPTARFGFAKGGMVTGDNMEKLFAEGGINTGNAEVDPVSGNEVPPGSMPKEVRDDIDAKLSGGEYVVPADVLRFYGVNFFEKLRKKAKEGLGEMDAEGRIGGDAEEDDEDFPFSEEELMVADEEDDMEFAAGGAVPFNPNSQMFGGQVLPTNPGAGQTPNPTAQNSGGMETKTYENTQGQKMQILFINGQPAAPVPTGFYPEGQAPKQTTPTPGTDTQKLFGSDRQELRAQEQKASGNSSTGRTWDPGIDFSDSKAVEGYVSQELNQAGKFGGAVGGIGGAILGPIAGTIGSLAIAGSQVSNARAASIIARSQGNVELADKLDGQINEYVNSRGIGGKAVMNAIATGELKARKYLEAKNTGKPATRQNAVSSSSRNSGTGNLLATRSADAKTTGAKKTSSNKDTTSASGSVSFSAANKSTPKPESKPSTSKPGTSSSQGGGKPRGGRATGGLVERRKK